MKDKVTKHLILIIISILLISLDIFWREIFFTLFLAYGLFIKFLLSAIARGNLKKILAAIIWISFAVIFGLTIYVNYYMPHGPNYPTGEVVCQNDDRGPCREKYMEDLGNLNIPNWAKFLRRSEGTLLLMGLLFAGLTISNKDEKE